MSDSAVGIFCCIIVPLLAVVGTIAYVRSRRRAANATVRFCPSCGAPNPKLANHCGACGRYLIPPIWTPPVTHPPLSAPSPRPVVPPQSHPIAPNRSARLVEEDHIRWLLDELERPDIRSLFPDTTARALTNFYRYRLAALSPDIQTFSAPAVEEVIAETTFDFPLPEPEPILTPEPIPDLPPLEPDRPMVIPASTESSDLLPHLAPDVVEGARVTPAPVVHPLLVAQPPAPAGPPREPFLIPQPWKEWDSAVILLYLGAFLIVVAGLIYSSYSWERLEGWQKVGLLVLTTIAFTGGGLALLPYSRVRPAAETFIGIGAFLVPMNAIAISNVSRDDATGPTTVGEIGALLVTVLYGFFSYRPGGIVYRYATVASALVAVALLPGALGAPIPWGVPLVVLATSVVVDASRQLRGHLRRFVAPVVHVGLVVLPVATAAGVAARWAESVENWWIVTATLAAAAVSVARLALRRADNHLAWLWTALVLAAGTAFLAALDRPLADGAVTCAIAATAWLVLAETGPSLARRPINRAILHGEAAALLLATPFLTDPDVRPLLFTLTWVAATAGTAAIARLRDEPRLGTPAAILATIAYLSLGYLIDDTDLYDSTPLAFLLAPAPLLLTAIAFAIHLRRDGIHGRRWSLPIWLVASAEAALVTAVALAELANDFDTSHKLATAAVCASFAIMGAITTRVFRQPLGLLAAALWLEGAVTPAIFALPISEERRLPLLLIAHLFLAGAAARVRLGDDWNVGQVRRWSILGYLAIGGVALTSMVALTSVYVIDLQRPPTLTEHPGAAWWVPYLAVYALLAALTMIVGRRFEPRVVWATTPALAVTALLGLRMAYGTTDLDPWRWPAIVAALAGLVATLALFWQPRIPFDLLLRRHLIGLLAGLFILPAFVLMAFRTILYALDLDGSLDVVAHLSPRWWWPDLLTYTLLVALSILAGRRKDPRAIWVTTPALAAGALLGLRMAYGAFDFDPWHWPAIVTALAGSGAALSILWRPRLDYDLVLRRHLIGLLGGLFALPAFVVMTLRMVAVSFDQDGSASFVNQPPASWWWLDLASYLLVAALGIVVGRRRESRTIWVTTTSLAAAGILGLRMAYTGFDPDLWRLPPIVLALAGISAALAVLWRPGVPFDLALRRHLIGLLGGLFAAPALILMAMRTAAFALDRDGSLELVAHLEARWWWPDLAVYVALTLGAWMLGRHRDEVACAPLVIVGLTLGNLLALRMLYGNIAVDGRHWWPLIAAFGMVTTLTVWLATRGREGRFPAALATQAAAPGALIGLPALAAMLITTAGYVLDLSAPYDLSLSARTSWWWPFLGFFLIAAAIGCLIGPRLRRLDLSPAVTTSAVAALLLLLRMAHAELPIGRLTWLPLLTSIGAVTAVGGFAIRRRWNDRFGRRLGTQLAAACAGLGLVGLVGSVAVSLDFVVDVTEPFTASHAGDRFWWWRFLILHLALTLVAWVAGRRTDRSEPGPIVVAFGTLSLLLGLRMATTDLTIWTYAGMAVAVAVAALLVLNYPRQDSPFLKSLRTSLEAGAAAIGLCSLAANLGLSTSGEGSYAVQTIVYALLCLTIFGFSLWTRQPLLAYGAASSALVAISFAVAALDADSANAGYAFAALSWLLATGSLAIPVAGRWTGQRIVWERSALAVAILPILLGVVPEGALDPGEPAYQRLVLAILSAAGVLALSAIGRRDAIQGYAASMLGLLGVLMQITIAEPANIQAYTAPVAVYLLGLAWFMRRVPVRFDALAGAGAALLMFPSFAQSFGPDGYGWALLCGAEGLAFVFAGLIFGRRVPVAAGVVGLTAIVLRQSVDYVHSLPTWAILAVVGVFLLGTGTLWLAAAEALTRRFEEMRARWGGLR